MSTHPLPDAVTATRHAPNGMVCSIDHLASAAGVAVLRDGGSAADAAIATSAVLAVTSQHSCGMGGDLFALVHGPGQERPAALNASGRAGSGADPERLRAEGHTHLPAHGDVRAAPVPGCVDGWLALHDRYGRLPLDRVLADAADLAEHGFPASPLLAAAVPEIAHLPGAHDYTRAGPIVAGTVLRRPGVARTLRAVATGGRDGFYGGAFGAGLLEIGGGEYHPDDLRDPVADWVDPLSVEAWGHRLWTVPPNSQGYLTLASAWLASQLALPEHPDDPVWAHLLVEAARQAGHDRLAVLHEHADGAALLDPDRLADRLTRIRPDRRTSFDEHHTEGDTVYLCAADRSGLGVSLIQSNAQGWGAHVVVPETGIFLHNRGIGFSLVPGHPAEYGPRRRPPHTLAPALLTGPDRSLAALVGTMGADSQPQVVLQLLVRLLHHGEAPGEALAAGRWRLASAPGGGFDTWIHPEQALVDLEAHAAPWDDGLAERGHMVRRLPPHPAAFGHAHIICRDGDVWAGASDHRAVTGGVAGH